MIEMPEDYTLSRQLNSAVKDKTIRNVVVGESPHKFAFYHNKGKNYDELLCGKRVDRTDNFAGLVEMSVEDVKIVFSDGVNIRFMIRGEKIPKKHQLLIEFDDDSRLVCTVQMYGQLLAFKEGGNDNFYYAVAKEKS